MSVNITASEVGGTASREIDPDKVIAAITGISAAVLLAIVAGAGLASSGAGVALTGAAVASPIPGDAAVVGTYMVSWMGKPPAAPRPKAYMTKAAVGL